MTLHKRNELDRAKWDAYQARQDASVIDRVLRSPVTFGICLAALCLVPVVAVILCLWG
jgi:uncharacterized membrane-anchored protein